MDLLPSFLAGTVVPGEFLAIEENCRMLKNFVQKHFLRITTHGFPIEYCKMTKVDAEIVKKTIMFDCVSENGEESREKSRAETLIQRNVCRSRASRAEQRKK